MVKAIETEYAGCRFRSRLEARWAVFFDKLGYSWEYEPEGFELPSGRYLPDFWLPGHDKWVEIKGSAPSHRDFERFVEFGPIQWQMGNRFVIIIGDVPRPYPEPRGINQISYSELPVPAPAGILGTPVDPHTQERFKLPGGSTWAGFAVPGQGPGIPICDEKVSDSCGCTFIGLAYTEWIPAGDFIPALYAARSARFEYGEHGTR